MTVLAVLKDDPHESPRAGEIGQSVILLVYGTRGRVSSLDTVHVRPRLARSDGFTLLGGVGDYGWTTAAHLEPVTGED